MKQIFILILLSLTIPSQAQMIHWDGQYKLKISDFKSPATQIGGDVTMLSVYTAAAMDFTFHMTNAEFMFTKNFNSKVSCAFDPLAASMVAPDSASAYDLLAFAQFEFDLTELYARKFRKKLYEQKGAFSDVSFFRPIYDENRRELTERLTIAGRQTDVGRNRANLRDLHDAALAEIAELSDFCKTCKPVKRKK